MFVETACTAMGEMLVMMLNILVFSSSSLRGLLRQALSSMQPHRKNEIRRAWGP
jgi:hypothetical protein